VRSLSPVPVGQSCPDAEEAVNDVCLEASAEEGRALAHPYDSVAASAGDRVGRDGVGDGDLEGARIERDGGLRAPVAVPRSVRECLLEDPIGGPVDARR
jgi:hypothetical protein